ncbi:MAG: outer membrane protein assembly factor BamC [Zetaproteobacteria bacterium]|nr:MAG: outer membrane protein assembly factor BamC [Zetaproteobacteria bacterium]
MRYVLPPIRITIFAAGALLLAACSGGMPKLFWDTEDDTPAYAHTSAAAAAKGKQTPKHLEVPPELRAKIELPMADQVAAQPGDELPERYRKAVAGKAVSLHARRYPLPPATVFSTVVDAMTSLNYPVHAVDSPSGIITTDWIRKGANNPSIAAMFGLTLNTLIRYRFIVRVYRVALDKGGTATQLEVRVLGQVFQNSHWVNQPLKRKVADELFQLVEELLARQRAGTPQAQGSAVRALESE